jgi:ubiquinone/menaquinone biosynthesis C-methylase UbiE
MKPPSAFDHYAAEYDTHFTDSTVGRAQRKQVWRALQPWLGEAPLEILEVNCGTGVDALRLASLGHHIRATDASKAMIDRARKKSRPVEGSVYFETAHFLELDQHFPAQSFDLVFSNFGGLNCNAPADTRRIATAFSKLLKPEGRLFLVYMTRNCAWERLYFYYKKSPRQAYRRRQRPLEVALHGRSIPVWYYPQRELKQLYAPHFRMEKIYPIGLGVPPSFLEHFFHRHPRLLRILEKADQYLAFSPLASYADHQALVFRKKRFPP